jgi:hypothetical protein
MLYAVKARFKPEMAAEFLQKLREGTIESQEPDGKEIFASMKRAKINGEGLVRWSEVCYCPTPLQHERETVYDRYFYDMVTRQVEDYLEFEGQPFMDYLLAAVDAQD